MKPVEGTERLLIVEDERIVACDLVDTLNGLGYKVVGVATTGEDAVVKARELAPSLILMDIGLAGSLDGVEAADQIHRDRAVPILYVTARSGDETLRRAKDTHSVGFLIKPFKAVDLRCALERAIRRHGAQADARAERPAESDPSSTQAQRRVNLI